jgi:CRP/FNR family cyclic AMP-dependent transcriptional regulator
MVDRSKLPQTSPADRVRAILPTIPLLTQLGEKDEARIAACARMQRAEAGAIIVERGDPPASLFAVAAGKLKVVAPRNGGRDATLHILGPGDVFGEVALFQPGGRTARVAAIEESVLMVIDHRDFLDLLSNSAELSKRLLALLAARLKNTIQHFDETTSLEAPQRLARKILLLAEQLGVPEGGGIALSLKLSQTELGELVDSTRQTVNRLLRAWQEAGIVDTTGGRLVVRDMAALRAAAEAP